jgi:hypothetical protein
MLLRTENEPTAAPPPERTTGDAFFHWEHLILLLTPFPIELVAWLAWIWGLDNDGADRIRALWIWPYTYASILTFFLRLRSAWPPSFCNLLCGRSG